MAKKIFVIVEDGLVSDVLVDNDLADDIHLEVLHFDGEAPDYDKRTKAFIRMITDLEVTNVGYFIPAELE